MATPLRMNLALNPIDRQIRAPLGHSQEPILMQTRRSSPPKSCRHQTLKPIQHQKVGLLLSTGWQHQHRVVAMRSLTSIMPRSRSIDRTHQQSPKIWISTSPLVGKWLNSTMDIYLPLNNCCTKFNRVIPLRSRRHPLPRLAPNIWHRSK